MEFRVKDLLNIPSLKDAVVLSGNGYLNNVIKGATIMEAPDITDWLKGGELIMTSFYPIRSFNEEEQKRFIVKLVEKGVSALVVKTHRYVAEIPEPMVSAGEAYRMPIIQIPKEIPYVDVLYPVMGKILNNQVIKLQYYKEIHDRFTALSLADEGPDKIIETLERLIGNPVALFDRNFHCIVSTLPSLAAFELVEKIPYYKQTEGIKFPHFRQIVKYPDLSGQIGYQIVVPVETMNNIKTYLLIGEVHKPLEELDFIAVENAATALSLELVKQFAVAEVDKKFKNDLLGELIEGKVQSPTSIYQNANLIGWDLSGSFAAVLFKVLNHGETISSKRNKWGLSMQNEMMVYDVIHRFLPNEIIGTKSNLVIVLWKIDDKEENDKLWMSKINQTARKIQELLKTQNSKMGLQVGIGNIATSMAEISASFKKAQDALELGEVLHGKETITAFSELGIFRLLSQIEDIGLLKTFIPASLQKLLDYAQANQKDLLQTLKVFLECNQNATRTAQVLYVHHKTAVYRLDRIKEITGMKFEDPEEMLSVQVGLKIINLLERENKPIY
ncbi:PucR family transcriptional regulator [Neobacillus notoginsengisoli]|uniref:PucR family transcriptional regulator n=1 Tax=Neobacillus notoginsengisoli TaxID=1578198 RepID=A0A417YMF0_9BACI|nr:PucR family transcriptional regulator [Neobacillus notoginsengisoli]RHW34828.1 PucR family transcriptional regulator [Neobacillus notoginsengisoli]